MSYPQSLTDDLSLSQAAAIYESTMENSTSKLPNPNGIRDEIAYLKEFSSKLKFQYLEQETRDKFLRLLLIENDRDVSREDVETLLAENTESKQALKLLKKAMGEVIERSNAVATEVITLAGAFDSRKAEVDESLAGVQSLQDELDELLTAGENENYRTLFNLKKLIDSEDIGLNEAISIANNALDQDALTLTSIELNIEKAKNDQLHKEKLIMGLHDRLRELNGYLEMEATKDHNKQEPEQVYAQWLRDLNSDLLTFVPNVEIHSSDGVHILTMGKLDVSLDGELNIVECTNAENYSVVIAAINATSNSDSKFWKLLALFSALLNQ